MATDLFFVGMPSGETSFKHSKNPLCHPVVVVGGGGGEGAGQILN